MPIEGVQWARAQFENFNGRLGNTLDPKPSALVRQTRSIHIQQDGAWKGIWGVIVEMLVSMPQTR